MSAMNKHFFLTLIALLLCLSAIINTSAQTRGWGFNETGALGVGNSSNHPTPQTVTGVPDATGISGGIDHSLFLRGDGTLAVAGRNDFGQFGSAAPADSNLPLPVPLLTKVPAWATRVETNCRVRARYPYTATDGVRRRAPPLG